MKQLNVCLLNDNFPPSIDGVSVCVQNYAQIIQSKLGYATVCTPQYPHADDRYAYTVLRYPSVGLSKSFGYRAGLPFDPRTIKKLTQKSFDIMHAHCPIMSMLMARTMRELNHRPIVLTYHSKYDVDIQKDISSAFLQEQARRAILSNVEAADAVWTVSRGAGESLRAIGYNGSFTVMPNGVDLPRGSVAPEAVKAVNERLGISPDMPVFLFIGRMVWYKGIRMILDGISVLKAENIPFRMLFIGGGQDKEDILRYAADKGLNDRCIFLPAEPDREMLRAYYTRGTFFLFPSEYDTNGLVVREAAACATASMTLRGSCAAEDITEGVNGITVTNAEDLARACREIACHPETAVQMGERALDELYLSWEDSVRHAYQCYGDVITDYMHETHHRRHGKSDAFFHTVARFYRSRSGTKHKPYT